jgi:hypothetical protein
MRSAKRYHAPVVVNSSNLTQTRAWRPISEPGSAANRVGIAHHWRATPPAKLPESFGKRGQPVLAAHKRLLCGFDR